MRAVLVRTVRSSLTRMLFMSDSKEDSNQEELEWLLFERDEAREDQRVSLDHIV